MNFQAPIADPLSPNFTFSNDIGVDLECFYWGIVPSKSFDPTTWGSVGRFNCLVGLECGFATANPLGQAQNGQQGVFQRIRLLWAAVPQVGFYVFKHPYGVENIEVTAADLAGGHKGLILTIDTPLITNIPPGNFNIALGTDPINPGKIGPFLSQVNPPVQISVLVPPIPPPYNKPTDWLGDGVTEATFTGSPPGTNGSPTGFNQFQFEAWQDAAHTIPLNLFTIPAGLPGPGTITNIMTTTTAVITGHRLHLPFPIGAIDLLLLDD